MLMIDETPSGRVAMVALLREPGETAPAWARAMTGSPSAVPRPKLSCWAFHVSSVKPRRYDQSCIRHAATNRLVTDASMSLPPVVKLSEWHPVSYQTLVHGNGYRRSGLPGRWPGTLSHHSAASTALPLVVPVDSPVAGSMSQARPAASLPTTIRHLGASLQHHCWRVSALG